MQKLKVISQYSVNGFNAGPKAKVDIEKILKENYNANVRTIKLHGEIGVTRERIKKAFFLIKNFKKVDILIIQCPFLITVKDFLHAEKKIALIHDIEGIREQDIGLFKKEMEFYNSCDVVISHNKVMSDTLRRNGVKKPIIEIELFDYLYNSTVDINEKEINNSKVITYAGNLEKSPFINELEEGKMDFNLNVYGNGTKINNNSKINYKGSFKPEDLPNRLEGTLGLVWDGHVKSKDDVLEKYTMYNTPHKLSCYLVSGMPVIVWEKSAVADFVKTNNIGYLISNIYDINNINLSDIDTKRKNVKVIREKLINGEFTKSAIDKALKICNETIN